MTPDTGGEWSSRPGITPDTGVGVVLEAWCYTREAGTEVIHVATTGSIPTAARGVDIQRRCHQYQGSVGDGSDWYTGILVFKVHRGS